MRTSLISALARYFAAILQDGDYANDWLTHLPRAMRALVRSTGHAVADALSSAPHGARAIGRMVGDVVTCGDPTLPERYSAPMLPVWRLLTRLYDALISMGVC